MAPVKLYIYDLSQGMARAFSMGFTGRQIGNVFFFVRKNFIYKLIKFIIMS
jgi:hypothetical protein